MSDRLTILWNKPRGVLSREEKDAGMAVIQDLQIDRAFRRICPDTMLREAFLSVLLTPLTDENEIAARVKVVQEFAEKPALLDRLTELIRRLMMVKNSWDSERSRLFASRRVNPQDKSLLLWTSRETLVLTAHFVRIALMNIREIHETLNMFGAVDGWLGRLKNAAYPIGASLDTDELIALCEKLEKHLANAHTYEIEFDCDDELRITAPFLREFRFIRVAEKQQKKGKNPLLSLFDKSSKQDTTAEKKAETEVLPEMDVPIPGMELEWGLETSAKAVQELDRYLTSFLRTLIDKFSGLEEELYFCKAVLMHIDRLAERNVKVIFPEFLPAEENTLVMKELSDLLLLTESMSVLSVVPNDVSCIGEGSGTLVTGKNNSGKTVYLRSIGTAVLLAQCGLPIPAQSAVISVRQAVYTTFAKAEGELVPLSSAGRFEEEVAQLASILAQVRPGSLLLLNETFQTTAYDEGADGMYHILAYLSSIGCGFIFVTHLMKLKELYKGRTDIRIMKTSDDPRTRYKLNIESN
ncbi:MAG: hypothetical protein IJ037_01375 [Clostridia bacterium]|nr:hypothetical protein [Clostridia bacterium]MBQ8512809.1 hypothetical protein [Clostridia bacterium]